MKLFFSSEEVASHLNISTSRLDFYVREFKLNINKVKRARKYTHADLEKLERIIDLIDQKGYTLDGAREQIKSGINGLIPTTEIINKLKDIKKTLEFIKESIE
jgi:DNA-binding transcriptional MerR regulator